MDNRDKVLVTGAAGFIGSHVCDELAKDNSKYIVGLDDLSGGFQDNLNSAVEFVRGSILDEALIESLFMKYKFSYVFHFAAYAAEGLSHFIRRFNYSNNLIGSANLINASLRHETVRCFVFTSSIAVYGSGQVPMTEETVPQPEDPYGIAKYAVEMDLRSAHEMFGLNYVIFRPHNVYGSKQNIGDPYRNVVGIFMNQILQDKPLTIFGDGRQTRAFSHISDVAPAIAASINRKQAYNEVFNIGADQPHSVIELAEAVCAEMHVEKKIVHLSPRNEVTHAYSSHEKVKQHFGDLIKNVPLHEGLQEMATWVRAKGARKGKKFSNIEVERNLPEAWKRL